jgi:glutaryl-CoA dehydrogenase (non-decarboxylating)
VKEGSSYVLNGAKTWISNAPVADTALVYASTDRSRKHHGLSAFYFDLNRPGVSRATLEKLGAHSSPTGQLLFEDCRIPLESRIGQEGEGFKICLWMLSETRLNCAAGALGVARAAREAAVRYANERKQFGRRIGEFQMIQDPIAEMIVREEAARLLVYRAAFLKDRGRPSNLETSIAKYSAAEAAAFASDAAFKILGAYAYSTDYPIERYLRDAKSYQIVEGSSNIQKIIIAEDALGYRKANR